MFQKHANAHLTQFILYELILSKFSTRDLILSSLHIDTKNIAAFSYIKEVIQICCYSHHAAIVPSVSKPHIRWAKSTKTKQRDEFLCKFQHTLLFPLMPSGPFTVCQETESYRQCYNHNGLRMYVQENILTLIGLIDTAEWKSKFSGIQAIFMVWGRSSKLHREEKGAWWLWSRRGCLQNKRWEGS